MFHGREDVCPAAHTETRVPLAAVAVLKLAGLSQLYLFGEQNFTLSPSGKVKKCVASGTPSERLLLSSAESPCHMKAFTALWWYLNKNESGLLVKADQRVVDGSTVTPHFVIFPTSSRHLLVKVR